MKLKSSKLHFTYTELIPGSHPANERRRYFVMASLNGCAQT